jgi:hypothetical protein
VQPSLTSVADNFFALPIVSAKSDAIISLASDLRTEGHLNGINLGYQQSVGSLGPFCYSYSTSSSSGFGYEAIGQEKRRSSSSLSLR